MYGPILKGKKSILQPPKISEAKNFVKWLRDPEVNHYLSVNFDKLTLKKEEGYLKKAKTEKNRIFWSIYTKDKVHIGCTSLENISKEHKRAVWGIVIGDKNYWGQGIGTDVLRTVVKYSFDKLKLHRFELSVFTKNIGGIKCYTRCGLIKEGIKKQTHFKQGEWLDEIIMGILKDDYFKKS